MADKDQTIYQAEVLCKAADLLYALAECSHHYDEVIILRRTGGNSTLVSTNVGDMQVVVDVMAATVQDICNNRAMVIRDGSPDSTKKTIN